MEIVLADNKRDQGEFLAFRRGLYKEGKAFIDNNYFMIREVFKCRTSFIEGKYIHPISIVDSGKILCQAVIIYTEDLPEYIHISFFESLHNQEEAVGLLVKRAREYGKNYNCKRIVAGLNGHVNYGLGFLNSHFDEMNSFSVASNPKYYNEYFSKLDFRRVNLNIYKVDAIDNRLDKYKSVLDRINKNYTFKNFDKKQFEFYSKKFTDLNNSSFENHRYYYKRKYKEDMEMLKELFLCMKEDSLIFAFKGDRPVGFILWYPDFNELGKKGVIFGVKHFFKNIFLNKNIETGKIMEFGVLEEYRKTGLALGLINQVINAMRNYKIKKIETSWVLEENIDSNIVCKAVCDRKYKSYVVYEKDI